MLKKAELKQRLNSVFRYEKLRYKLKGSFYLFIAFLQALVFFYYVPDWMQSVWKKIIPLGQWKNVFAVLTFLHPIACFVFINSIYVFVYWIKHPFFEQYRVLKQPWPWERTKEEWIPWRNKLIQCTVTNIVIVNICLLILNYIIGVEYYNHSLDNLPSKFECLWQIAFFMVCDDFFFYFTHRLFHWKPLYRFHKTHHEHNVSTSFSNLQTHPVDYIFSNVISVVSGFFILGNRCHFTTYYLWNIFRVFETADGHSGYEFPWSMFRLIPFSGSSEYHNFHHSKNVGNFSSFFTFWDSLLGTNKEFLKHKEKQNKEVT